MTRELAMPFAVDTLGRIAFVEDPYQQIANHLILLVGTRLNERVMLPTYGLDTLAYVFDENDEATLQRLTLEVEQAVGDWEPLVEVRDIEPDVDQENGILGVTVYFSLRGIDTDTSVYQAYIKTGGTVVSSRG